MSFAISKWRLVAAAAFVVALALGGMVSTGERAEGTVAGMNGIVTSTFTAAIPPPINTQHSACKSKVTTSGTTVTAENHCYNVTKTGTGVPPVPPPPPPPYSPLDAPGFRTTLTGTMNPTTGAATLSFAGNPCLPADSDNDMTVDDGVTVQLTTTLKNDMMGSGTVHLEFFLNGGPGFGDCAGSPTSTSDDPFTPTNLSDTDDSDINDPNITGPEGPDGCSTSEELGSTEGAGGDRDPWNPWDFYDVDGNGTVDLFVDIFGVAGLFGQSNPPIAYDRSGVVGPNPWNINGPDGTIDLFLDIFGVANQFGHACAGTF